MLKVGINTRTITEVHLAGTLDETVNLKSKLKGLGGKVHIYGRWVSHANSFGLKMWIMFWKEMRDNGAQLEFFEVSPFLVSAVNSINDFIPIHELRSVCAPFYCKSCLSETVVSFSMQEIMAFNRALPEIKCKSCGHASEFNEHSDYLGFLEKWSAKK